MSRAVLHNAFCDAWGIEVPIFLAGMGVGGRATPPALVAAVSQAGGLGVLGCSGLSPEETRRRIRAVRALTDKPFGVDLLLPARIAEYVVVHEIAHLHEPHHTPAFWLRIERAMPDYAQRKTWLAEHGIGVEGLGAPG